jgi:hypothetical protein
MLESTLVYTNIQKKIHLNCTQAMNSSRCFTVLMTAHANTQQIKSREQMANERGPIFM